uniref:Poly [ADP-ribose] polymerase n=1 Tax=Sphenodon punctatus TaxID=8508 RepID=A0A8D0LB93_SPHPU
MLTLLVGNVNASLEDDDFSIEMIPEINAAVVTFIKPIDTVEFAEICTQYLRKKDLKFTARPLELTQSIMAENIPSSVAKHFITLYFESPKNGGGHVSDVKLLLEENSAIVTFSDHKALKTVLAKQHFLDKQLISVHPYYDSLGTVLYGKERPQIKMPEPVMIPVDPYILQFIQSHDKIVQEITRKMTNYHCELTWPQPSCTNPEITIYPSASLSKKRRSVATLIRTWKEDASTAFVHVTSKYKTVKCKVNAVVWEAVKTNLVTDGVLVLPDLSKEIVILAGTVFLVEDVEEQLKEHMENATKEAERQNRTIEEMVAATPGKYAVLQSAGLEKNVSKDYPDLKISYSASTKTIRLRGVAAEVYKIKSDVLEKVHNLSEKSIKVDPHIFQFLQRVDNRLLSESLFFAKKITAFYELADDTIVLIGSSHEGLLEAEEEMRKSLDHKCIPLEQREVIRKSEWRKLTSQLHKTHNSSKETVIIDDMLAFGRGDEVIIVGYSRAVAEVYHQLSDFVNRNTQIQKVISAKSVAVVQFLAMKKKTSSVWPDLIKKGVKIDFGTPLKRKGISLSGPKEEVMKGAAIVEQFLSLLHSTSVMIDKPGAKAFFRDKESIYVHEANQKFSCLIRLQDDGENGDDSDTSNDKRRQLRYKINLQDGVVVAVYKGDLTRYQVDVVVNASNEDLQHIGGLAGALLNAAGPELQSECDLLVRKRGRLQPGRAVITDAGNLPCKQVIHAVGPRWKHDESEKCVRLLKKAVRESLQLAETYNHQSIAIPAISSGIFGFPLRLCARTIVTSIKETVAESRDEGCLKQIHLVDSEEKTVQALADALKEVCKDTLVPQRSPSQSKTCIQPGEIRRDESRKGLQMITTDEGLRIILEKKDIEDATTDVIVSSVGTDLKLGVGPLSKALLDKAGPMLQPDFAAVSQGQVARHGGVFQTNGWKLTCRIVLHAIVPEWDQGKGPAVKILEGIIRECLEKTEELSLSSVTLPAIGTGGFGFPKHVVAKLMFEEVLRYSSQKNLKSLQEVHFLLHPKDTHNIQAFSDELEYRISGKPKTESMRDHQSSAFFGHISTLSLGVHEIRIGSIKLQVATGDITKEKTDVIVNVSNSTFNANSGVSKAVLEGAGPEVASECAAFALQPHSGFVTTQGGKLFCKKIIHLVHHQDIQAQVSKVLQECEVRKYTSVAFPALGTGQAGQSPDKVADDMMGAIVAFASKKSAHHVKMIKIVIFQPHMQNAFYACMQKRDGTALTTSESWFSKVKSFFTDKKRNASKKKRALVLEKKIESAIFEICGESQKNVEDTVSWIKNLILKEQVETVISDDLLETFDDAEIEKLQDLQKSLHIAICLDTKQSPPFIKVSGIPRDVLKASTEIQTMLKRIKETQEQQFKAELLINLVEWKYSHNNTNFITFDILMNLRLEEASKTNKAHVDLKINGKNYRANVNTLHATDHHGKSITIKRVQKGEDKQSVALPKDWEDMKGDNVKVVQLNPATAEYQDVQTKFLSTCSMYKIVKIERIQNPYLWRTYQIKKEELDKKSGNTNNERCLFHGTPSSSLNIINYTGFNRSYAGKNAAAIGRGTYFAVGASYSAQDTYSRPDVSGAKYVYLARVLTGEFCAGNAGLITPPSKTNGGVDLYDSVVDNVTRPSMFVIFYDTQAYPEYLITFRR